MSGDRLDRLAKVLYGRGVMAGEYLGGPNAKILSDAANRIEELQSALLVISTAAKLTAARDSSPIYRQWADIICGGIDASDT